MTTTLKFKCTLLSDVILNQKAATEGPNKTLDFIPGSCFLGIVASKLYKEYGECEKTMDLFHSGKVRFGDAHPSKGDVRGLKIPASMSYPKLGKPSEELYIHHLVPNLESEEMREKQLKQCRSGFYVFADNEAKEVKTNTNFAIKSAFDKYFRRSADEKMYGYESLQKGLELYFEVEVDDNSLLDDIKGALIGEDKRVGRSRTAQYGLVKIEEKAFVETESKKSQSDVAIVYADGRLIFLDEFGLPTFRPSAKDLGIDDGEILWEKSQVRIFQYAPWNYTRQCFDADRCGMEKGSVFVVKTSQTEFQPKYVGSYNNEGFGKIIYNPTFLEADSNGKAVYKICEFEAEQNREKKELKGNVLLDFIGKCQKVENIEFEVYTKVNQWVAKYKDRFRSESFASQWGAIRSIAMTHPTKSALEEELFLKHTLRNGKSVPNAYLTHGVAADKWNEKGRLKALREFFDSLNDDNAQIAVINLAAEMAKKCKEDKR